MPSKTRTASDALQSRLSTAKTLALALAFALMASLLFGMQAYKKFTIEPERAIAKCYFQMWVLDREKKECRVMEETFTLTPDLIRERFGDRLQKVKTVLFVILGVGVVAFILFTVLFYKVLLLMDRGKTADVYLRGARKATPDELRGLLEKEGTASPITIGGVPIVAGSETTHFLIAGATGVGKSVAIKELLDHARAARQRAIVYDPSGEFVEAYYREGTDLLLNPFDKRAPRWNIFEDIGSEFDYADVVQSLIPMPANTNDPFWVNAPRGVLESMLRNMKLRNNYSNRYLYETLTTRSISELHRELKGWEGAAYLDPSNEKTANSVRSVLSPYLLPFKYLSDTGGDPFSLKRFIADDSADRWVFIRVDMDQLNALRPLISLWLDLAITATLSLEVKPTRRLWFVMDEFATLQKVSKVKDLLDKGRKYGACAILGMQNISQLKESYGKEGATSMVTNCKTWVIYNTPDSETAKYLAENIGNEEVLATKASQSESSDAKGGGSQSTTTNYQTEKKLVVMPEEIMYLPNLAAFLKLAGDHPVARISLEWKARPTRAPKFIPRES